MRTSNSAALRAAGARMLVGAIVAATTFVTTDAAFAGGVIQPGTLLQLADGEVQGQAVDGVREFLGIPFAAPPTGELRFRPPVTPTPWAGVLDATSYSSSCPQLANGPVGTGSEDEDCLYLNVWTPIPAPATPRPVLFWIHGGSNTSGSTANFVPYPPYTDNRHYDGSTFASENGVVLVSVNYRVGVFGFFGHSDLAGEDGDWPYAGNQGLLDQRAGLEWVRDNIAAFGGDPANVTIFGESAGAWDVCTHVLSPASAGLFHRAISQSGGCSVGTASAEESADRADEITTAAGCDGAPDILACLRALPVADLLDAATTEESGPGIGASLGVSVDGGFLPDEPRVILDSGDFARVPYMLGTNTDEATIFFTGLTPITTEEQYTAILFDRFGSYADEVEALYPASAYPSPQDALERLTGDATLVCSTYDTARRVSAARNKTFVYHFARELPLSFVSLLDLGVFHGSELAMLFGSLDPAPTAADQALGSRMRAYWSSFAARGKPKAKGAAGWPRFNARSWKMLRLNAPSITKLSGYRKAECDFWTSYYEATGA
jgi:para-nitrobenzyl esterase